MGAWLHLALGPHLTLTVAGVDDSAQAQTCEDSILSQTCARRRVTRFRKSRIRRRRRRRREEEGGGEGREGGEGQGGGGGGEQGGERKKEKKGGRQFA